MDVNSVSFVINPVLPVGETLPSSATEQIPQEEARLVVEEKETARSVKVEKGENAFQKKISEQFQKAKSFAEENLWKPHLKQFYERYFKDLTLGEKILVGTLATASVALAILSFTVVPPAFFGLSFTSSFGLMICSGVVWRDELHKKHDEAASKILDNMITHVKNPPHRRDHNNLHVARHSLEDPRFDHREEDRKKIRDAIEKYESAMRKRNADVIEARDDFINQISPIQKKFTRHLVPKKPDEVVPATVE